MFTILGEEKFGLPEICFEFYGTCFKLNLGNLAKLGLENKYTKQLHYLHQLHMFHDKNSPPNKWNQTKETFKHVIRSVTLLFALS
jgi:hypothetical protein